MKRLLFAANWKMHLGPQGARQFLAAFLERYEPRPEHEVWFFPPAVSLEAVAAVTRSHPHLQAGVQNVFWQPEGAFTGELSVGMAREAGARAALVGHSERRHVFGERDEETGKKVRAVLEGGLVPVLCVGERLDERESGRTLDVVGRQLAAGLDDVAPDDLDRIVIAYEPVWAIGTGRTATPEDAAEVHGFIRQWLRERRAHEARILYGGSVKPDNAAALVRHPEIDGVLVGGASLKPGPWAEIVQAALD